MEKIEEVKKTISDFHSEKKEIMEKIEVEKKNFENLSEKLKNEWKEKHKKITTTHTGKVQTLNGKLDIINEKEKKFAGELLMSFINKELTQEQFNELTNLLKG